MAIQRNGASSVSPRTDKNKADAERDLLYGIMAVQLGLASAKQVITAASEWAVDRSQGLAARLVAEGVVPQASSDMLLQMVDRAVAAHGGDTSQTLRTFGGESAVLESFGGSIVLAPGGEIISSHALESVEQSEGGASDSTAGLKVTPVVRGRYTLRDKQNDAPTLNPRLAEIGRGGIGRVLVAFDEHLGREVAIKELLPVRVGGSLDKVRVSSKRSGPEDGGVKPVMSMERVSALVARFLREARVTGQLEHPNIVPVYELGRNQDDTLYYTMKMVRGRTLTEALRECHGLADRLKLLGHFVDMCQAIAYAHSRGVVHRDLKPDNVMLGEFGETVVLDWGLAKVRGVQDLRGQDIEREIQLLREVAGGQTVDGTAVGTPAYMSPEQAEGDLETIDERSDVWSLGCVLYQILCGHPPYEGQTAYEVIGRVLREPVRPVREVIPEAPAELASVCEKALCRDRAGRYQRAGDLAGDVNAFLTGGRVRAYDYRLGDLILRTLARYKVAFTTGAVALVLLMALGVWSYLRVVADRDRAQALKRTADAARQDARLGMAEAHWEGARAALMRRDMLESRAKLRSSLEVVDSVAGRVLWSQTEEEPLVWKRKLGALLYDLTYSPRGDLLAAAGHDGSIYLLDPGTAEVSVLRGHEPWVAALDFSPDGRLLASAGSDKTVRIWDVATAKTLRVLEGHSATINDLAFSPDGKQLASCSFDKTIRLWDVQTGAEQRVINGDKKYDFFWTLTYHPDGQQLISGGRDDHVRLWDLADGSERFAVRQSDKEKELVSALHVSSDGTLLASAGSGNVAYVWDLASFGPGQAAQARLTFTGHTDGIAEVQFSPDGSTLASGAYDNTVRLWNVTGPAAGRERARIKEHSAWVGGVAFSPDGRYLATGSEDRSVCLFRLPIDRARSGVSRGHTDMVSSLALHPDGRTVASGSHDKTVRLWDLARGQVIRVLSGPKEAIRSIDYLKDGTLLVTSWDRLVYRYSPQAQADGLPPAVQTLQGQADLVHHFELSPNERWLVSSEYDRSLRIWSLTDGAERKLVGHKDLVRAMAFSPDSKILASGSWDKTIRLWDPEAGKLLRTLTGHAGEVSNVRFSPDGKTLYSASWDQTLRRWDLASGQNELIGRYEGRLVIMAVHPSGRYLVTGSEAGLIALWNLTTNKPMQLRGHRDVVMDVRFSTDGKLLVSASDDGTVHTWDVETGQPHWRAPLLIPFPDRPPLAHTHRGWFVPGQEENAAAPFQATWLEAAQRARQVSIDPQSGRTVCILTGDKQFDIWDRDADRLRFQRRLEPIDRVLAYDGGCAVLAAGTASLFSGSGSVVELARGASAIGLFEDRVMVASGGRVTLFDSAGKQVASRPADVGITALLRIAVEGEAQIAAGYADGTVEVMPLSPSAARRNLSLEEVPSSPVVHMSPGPQGTVVLGYANGLLGLWDLRAGARLDHLKLHGALAHAALFQEKLYLVTELGDHLAWDLGIFHTDYCQLMGWVWDRIPVIWQGGRPVRKDRPSDHPCSATP